MGAISSGGVRVLNDDIIHSLEIPPEVIEEVTAEEWHELERRERLYRDDRPPPEVRGRIAILIDDGLATGSTMRAAVAGLRRQRPGRIVVAVPVGAVETCAELREAADEVVCARNPDPFLAVGVWYGDFSQTTDAEVRSLLENSAEQRSLVPHEI
jgi:putative phosphoribosyl transferase